MFACLHVSLNWIELNLILFQLSLKFVDTEQFQRQAQVWFIYSCQNIIKLNRIKTIHHPSSQVLLYVCMQTSRSKATRWVLFIFLGACLTWFYYHTFSCESNVSTFYTAAKNLSLYMKFFILVQLINSIVLKEKKKLAACLQSSF